MPIYKDIKTGSTLSTNCILGGDWVLVDSIATIESTAPETEVVKDDEVNENIDELTVPELKARLDELGVTYPTNARKQDLIDILSQF